MLCCILVALLLAPLGLSATAKADGEGAACCRSRTLPWTGLLLMPAAAMLGLWLSIAIVGRGKPDWRFVPVCHLGSVLTAALTGGGYPN